jgi:hypothetical protein
MSSLSIWEINILLEENGHRIEFIEKIGLLGTKFRDVGV